MTDKHNEILLRENILLDAMKSGNIAVLDELLHDDLVFVIPTGDLITKAMDIENYRSGIMRIDEITATNRTIAIVEDLATVTVNVHLKAHYADNPIDGHFKYLRIWKMCDNAWQIIAGSGFQL